MARRCDEPDSKTLDIVESAVERVHLEFATVAGTGIDCPDRQASPQSSMSNPIEGACEFVNRRVAYSRRTLGQRRAYQAFEEELAHDGLP
ncbi:hypothetical protein MesoLj113c_05670 [Mesorhizobium sp. 113-3-9]|nr:hypothetical protein MesoLj113c_05670 [Mesorhizobium sp. 113-3-9]